MRYHDDVDSTFWKWCNAWSSDAFRGWNIESELASIQCPLLLVQGDEDEYASLEQVYGIKRVLTQAELRVMPKVRHTPHLERPDQLISHCKHFYKTPSAPPPSPTRVPQTPLLHVVCDR